MVIVQLSLFEDPRDKALEQALSERDQIEWYQNPIHRYEDGGGLWYHLNYIQKIPVDLEYCRAWMARGHKGWNGQ